MFQRWVKITVLCWLGLLVTSLAWAAESSATNWPQEIQTKKGVVVIYQPQPETLKDNQLKMRAAVAVELKDSKEPVFGAVWMNARLETDRAERTATIVDIDVTDVRFPNIDDKQKKQLASLLERDIPLWNMVISMDELLSSLKLVEQRTKAAEKIKTEPPEIIFMAEPAILVTIDGDPQQRDEKNTKLKRVINTAFTLLFDPATKTWYLNADPKTWYTAKDIMGEWTIADKMPQEVAALAPKEQPVDAEEAKEDKTKPGAPPKIVVRTKPAELISTEGKPEFKPIEDSDLLYMSNTDSDVLMDIKQQKYYILLSGRWYISKKMEGPWKYIPGEELPKDFAKIPEDSNMGTVLYAVPGTDVAREAVLDAQIPQTAAIDLSKAKLTVEYDGEPRFEAISSTSLSYAVNTVTPIIKVSGNQYYACDEAVWFVASSPTGAWKVATSVPSEIYTIPPDSPMYHITFVKVYKVEPEVVYVGYTPGYTHTYVYGATIVYGTGYYWPGWYGHYYYPYPATWGYHVRWNPYTGWRFGISYSSGPFTFTIGHGGWYRGGWWGPARYRGYRSGYRHGYRRGAYAGYRAGYRSGQKQARKQNIYRSQQNKARATPTNKASQRARARPSTNRPNNVYTDRQGNVHRKTDKGWQNQTREGWQSSPKDRQPSQKPAQKPAQKPSQQPSQRQSRPQQSGSYNQQQLNRSHQSRQQGAQRSQNYSRARSGGARGGGGARMGGGGGRR